jgi:arylsulfatase A-like enzyme
MPLSAAERGYFANVTRFDDVVGQLVSHLEQRGLTERTVVIYLNDNGWDRAHFDDVRLNGPRGKGTIYDLGFRTPIVVWAPGRVRTGVHRDLVSILDVMPTVLDLAGVPIPPSLLGQSLRAALHGGAVPGREAIVGWRPPEWSAFGARRRVRGEQFFVRTDRWRYVWQPDTASQGLYRIETDPREEHDVLAEFPAVGRELRAQVQPWVAERSRAIAGPPRLAREARPVQ